MDTLFELSFSQYHTVLNTMNLTIGIMAGSALLFALMRKEVAPAYRLAVSLMAVVVAMAAYHYLRIYDSWQTAYALQDGRYVPTGEPFNYAYRYADWLGTVPLILAAVVLVLDLGRARSSSLVARVVTAAVLMIGLGYVGELERESITNRALWGFASTLPFVYITYVLWVELGGALAFETDRVRTLFTNLRLLLVASWGFYPVVYMLPMFGLSGAAVETAVQVGNSAADVLAKAVFGLMIFAVAREKTESTEEYMDDTMFEDEQLPAGAQYANT